MEGMDIDVIFATVVKILSIRNFLGLAAKLDLKIEQMDMKTMFFHGELEELYIEPPKSFREESKEHLVCR